MSHFILRSAALRRSLQDGDTWEVTKLEAMNGPESIDDHLHDDKGRDLRSTISRQWL